jgi:hypothetical protein
MMSRPKSLHDLMFPYQVVVLLLVLVSGLLGGVGFYFWKQSVWQTLRTHAMTEHAAQEARGHLYRQMKEVFDAAFLEDEDALHQYQEKYATLIESDLAALRGAP